MIDLELRFERDCAIGVVCDEDRGGKYKVVAGLRPDIEDWCAETLSGDYAFSFDLSGKMARFWIAFENDADAVLFKLRWQ